MHEEKWEGNYTFDKPVVDEWKNIEFDDAAWKTGVSAFGTKNEPDLSTLWDTQDIWIRRVFELQDDLVDKDIYLHYSNDDIFLFVYQCSAGGGNRW